MSLARGLESGGHVSAGMERLLPKGSRRVVVGWAGTGRGGTGACTSLAACTGHSSGPPCRVSPEALRQLAHRAQAAPAVQVQGPVRRLVQPREAVEGVRARWAQMCRLLAPPPLEAPLSGGCQASCVCLLAIVCRSKTRRCLPACH